MYFSYCDDFGNHGRASRVAATTAHADRPGGPGVRECRRPRSEFRKRCDTYTNFVQPQPFNHSRLPAWSQPAEMPASWRRGGRGGPRLQPLKAGGETGTWHDACDPFGLIGGVDVDELGQQPEPEPGPLQPGELMRARVGPRHRHVEHQGGIDLPQAE